MDRLDDKDFDILIEKSIKYFKRGELLLIRYPYCKLDNRDNVIHETPFVPKLLDNIVRDGVVNIVMSYLLEYPKTFSKLFLLNMSENDIFVVLYFKTEVNNAEIYTRDIGYNIMIFFLNIEYDEGIERIIAGLNPVYNRILF
jgi:hypothetical protein